MSNYSKTVWAILTAFFAIIATLVVTEAVFRGVDRGTENINLLFIGIVALVGILFSMLMLERSENREKHEQEVIENEKRYIESLLNQIKDMQQICDSLDTFVSQTNWNNLKREIINIQGEISQYADLLVRLQTEMDNQTTTYAVYSLPPDENSRWSFDNIIKESRKLREKMDAAMRELRDLETQVRQKRLDALDTDEKVARLEVDLSDTRTADDDLLHNHDAEDDPEESSSTNE